MPQDSKLSLQRFAGDPSEYDAWRSRAAFYAMQSGKLANWKGLPPKIRSLSGLTAEEKTEAREEHLERQAIYDADSVALCGALMAVQDGEASAIAETYFQTVEEGGEELYSAKDFIALLDAEYWDKESMSSKFVCLLEWMSSKQGTNSFNTYASKYSKCIKRLKSFDPPEDFSQAILCLVFVQGLNVSYQAFKESVLLKDASSITLTKIIKDSREWKSRVSAGK